LLRARERRRTSNLRWADLTPRQQDVATSRAPITLVIGGAGTGKTTAALWAARNTLESPETHGHVRALFLTFSRTAVEQIGERSQRVGELESRIEISTFHSFAMRILRAFGPYAGRGRQPPSIQSKAHERLFGRNPELLIYDDLVPAAIEILRSSTRLRALAEERWPVVICDEFQDTSEEQLELLTLLGDTARLILLADPHQMIYTFVPGVGPERLAWARDAAGEAIIELEAASHRDPSGVIPAMAAAVRERAFDDAAVLHAVDTEALRIRTATDDDLIEKIADELRARRAAGHRSIGIYGQSNDGVAQLGASLTDAGVVHTLVGIPEAQGEGLSSLMALTKYGCGDASVEEARIALAIFLTACVRGTAPPLLAQRLAYGHDLPPLFEPLLDQVLDSLQAASAEGLGKVAEAAAGAWEQLGVTAGRVPWRRASYAFLAAARSVEALRLSDHDALAKLEADVIVFRSGALVTDGGTRTNRTTLMNFHQTKGREADAVILVYRDGDFLAPARAREPFTEQSRLLYVALTRARKGVTVILPFAPHPLVAPFRGLAL
jgi:DNA helicase II / ATP-dependent DNA helicase PcrA